MSSSMPQSWRWWPPRQALHRLITGGSGGSRRPGSHLRASCPHDTKTGTMCRSDTSCLSQRHRSGITTTDPDTTTAFRAFSGYGKGRGHPAQLNLGGCFASAVAANRQARLLFKGDDFSKTDIHAAAAR